MEPCSRGSSSPRSRTATSSRSPSPSTALGARPTRRSGGAPITTLPSSVRLPLRRRCRRPIPGPSSRSISPCCEAISPRSSRPSISGSGTASTISASSAWLPVGTGAIVEESPQRVQEELQRQITAAAGRVVGRAIGSRSARPGSTKRFVGPSQTTLAGSVRDWRDRTARHPLADLAEHALPERPVSRHAG